MTQEYKYSLTRVCLRRGEMSLSRSLASLFEDAGDRVDDARGVHLVGHVVDRRSITVPLLCDGVDDDRPLVVLRVGQGVEQGLQVMALDGADVLHTELGEQLRGENL